MQLFCLVGTFTAVAIIGEYFHRWSPSHEDAIGTVTALLIAGWVYLATG